MMVTPLKSMMLLVGFSAANPGQDLFGSNWISHPDDPKEILF
jgi:hypothetical protein